MQGFLDKLGCFFMKSFVKSFFFFFVFVIFLNSCLSKKNPIVEIQRAFPEKVRVPLEDLDGKFWFAILNGQPLESGKYFVNCFDFRDIAAKSIEWASPIYTPRKEGVEILDKNYVPIDEVKDNKLNVYFRTEEVKGKTMIVANYFIVYIEVSGDYFDEKESWGGERISKFIFPKKDFAKMDESFDKKVIAQLVLFEDYEKNGDEVKVKLNFAQSVYVDDFSAETEEKKLKKIRENLIARNRFFIQSGGIFESLWVEHRLVDADDALLQQWKVKSNAVGNVLREYECGEVYNRDGNIVPFGKKE